MSKPLSYLLAFALLLIPSSLVTASDALHRIPENALGFVVVHNLAEANKNLEQLLKPFDTTLTSPLAFLKGVTDLNVGIDFSGDMVIALLPGGEIEPSVEPMILLPISSYQEFAVSIHADTSGEICRVTLLGEDILVAQDGPFALLMNIESREEVEKMVSYAAEPVALLEPLADWFPKNDLALVLMPTGIQMLGKLPQQSLLNRRHRHHYGFSPSKSIYNWLDSLVTNPKLRFAMQKNVELLAVGLTVDDQSNIHLTQQLFLRKNSLLARQTRLLINRPKPKLGLANKPCVLTVGGPIAPDWRKQFVSLLMQMDQNQYSARTRRRIKIEPALLVEKQKAYSLLFENIESCSVMMLTGKKGDPLCGNFLGVATVADTTQYFASLTQVIETWNKLSNESEDDFKPDFELLAYQAGGKQGHEIVVDVATTAADPRVPMLNWMLEAVFGPEGKLRVQLVKLDEKTFVFGMATPEQMTKLIAAAQQEQGDQPVAAELQSTYQLLNPNASWKLLVSPQECVRWAVRLNNEYMFHITNKEITLPKLANSPPIGISINADKHHWQAEIVCPESTWEIMGEYLKENYEDF